MHKINNRSADNLGLGNRLLVAGLIHHDDRKASINEIRKEHKSVKPVLI